MDDRGLIIHNAIIDRETTILITKPKDFLSALSSILQDPQNANRDNNIIIRTYENWKRLRTGKARTRNEFIQWQAGAIQLRPEFGDKWVEEVNRILSIKSKRSGN